MIRKQNVLYFAISITIFIVCLQLYWMYIQYEQNRNHIIIEIQSLFEKTVSSLVKENYAEDKNTVQLSKNETDSITFLVEKIVSEIMTKDPQLDSLSNDKSISFKVFSTLIDLHLLNERFDERLNNLGYALDYNLILKESEMTIDSLIKQNLNHSKLIALAEIQDFDNKTKTVELQFLNPIQPAIVRSFTGILLSLLLIGVVLSTIFYFQKIIQKQKKVSEIKNDFISNITHEFKTPIATVSGALEAIKKFNEISISEKMVRYIDMSEQQLKKLNLLVEKIMETSLLEYSEIHLEKKSENIITIIQDAVNRNQWTTDKKIIFTHKINNPFVKIDVFHFENAISNIIENAVKYGGNLINVSLLETVESYTIQIKDNGNGIHKDDLPYIFDKFFRAKNTLTGHLKGFGIGLFYSKSIIEIHGGHISVKLPNIFLIELWKK